MHWYLRDSTCSISRLFLYSLTKFSDDPSFKDERTANGYRALGQGETGRRRATAARRVLPFGGREGLIWATVRRLAIRTIGCSRPYPHAEGVARELMFKTDGILGEAWSMWSMHVENAEGLELFSFEMSQVPNGNGK